MSSNEKTRQYFLKLKGSLIINNKLMIPSTFVILFNGNHSFFIFTNLSVNKDDQVSCLFPENIRLKGTIANTGELPNSAFKLIEPHVFKSVIQLDSESKGLLAYSKELFRKEYTFVI
jgi:hypothetical protein